MDDPESLTFEPVQYDPNNPASLRRRGKPVQLGSSRYTPYPHSATSSRPSTSLVSASIVDVAEGATDFSRAPQPSQKDYDKTQQQAIEWAQKRLVMDSVFAGWIRNVTKDEKAKMDTRAAEIISQASIKFNCILLANKYLKDFVTDALVKDRRQLAKRAKKFLELYDLALPSKLSDEDHKSHVEQRRTKLYDPKQPFDYYLHGKRETPTSTDVLLFAHPAVKKVHILHWYDNKKSPLCDEEMRSLISTTPIPMLSGSATATRCAIDRFVESGLSKTSNTPSYSTDAYAGEQDLITNAMSYCLQTDLHGESFKEFLLDLHADGLRVLHKMLNLSLPRTKTKTPIYVPMRAEELSIPRLIPCVGTIAWSPLVQMSDQTPSMAVLPQAPMSDSDDFDFNIWLSRLPEEPQPEASGSKLIGGPFNL